MTVTFGKRSPGTLDFAVISGCLALLALGAARFLPLTSFLPACQFHTLFGIPCPTCGTTRALVCIAHLDLRQAFLMNPLVSSLVAASLFSLLYRLVGLSLGTPAIKVSLSRHEVTSVRIVAILAVSVQWLYLFLRD